MLALNVESEAANNTGQAMFYLWLCQQVKRYSHAQLVKPNKDLSQKMNKETLYNKTSADTQTAFIMVAYGPL